jgi:hypothetical protein
MRGIVPRIHVFLCSKTWMAVTSTAMTLSVVQRDRNTLSAQDFRNWHECDLLAERTNVRSWEWNGLNADIRL